MTRDNVGDKGDFPFNLNEWPVVRLLMGIINHFPLTTQIKF